jgi:ABC-type branched-subunit amino acid transport system ATPase component
VRRILSVATRAYLLEEGRITLSGSGDQLRDHPHLQESLYGIVAEAG